MTYFDIIELTVVEYVSDANAFLRKGWKLIDAITYADETGVKNQYILGKPSYLP